MQSEEKLREYLAGVYRLAQAVGVRAGLNVEVKLQKREGLGFWADGKKFAQVNREKSGAVIYTGTKKEWALRAEVADLACGHRKNGWRGTDDESYWRIDVSDDDKLQKTASILGKICRARLQ